MGLSNEQFRNIVERFFSEPGLTVAFAGGGTRTHGSFENLESKIAEVKKQLGITSERLTKQEIATIKSMLLSFDPGELPDLSVFGRQYFLKNFEQIQYMQELGVRNAIITVMHFQAYDRPRKYVEFILNTLDVLMNEIAVEFYTTNKIDPHFIGIDTLLVFPQDSLEYKAGKMLDDFQKNWEPTKTNFQLYWEVFSIPGFTILEKFLEMGEDNLKKLRDDIVDSKDMIEMANKTNSKLNELIYGGNGLPKVHIYYGNKRHGNLSVRTPMPATTTAGFNATRFFYSQYPSFMTQKLTWKRMISDLLIKIKLRSTQTDHKGEGNIDDWWYENNRAQRLSTDPNTLDGLLRTEGYQGENTKDEEQ